VNNRVHVKTYTSLHNLVNDMFPAQTSMEQVYYQSDLKSLLAEFSVLSTHSLHDLPNLSRTCKTSVSLQF
jgi:hypothetical protein